jgi:hypothetical protein
MSAPVTCDVIDSATTLGTHRIRGFLYFFPMIAHLPSQARKYHEIIRQEDGETPYSHKYLRISLSLSLSLSHTQTRKGKQPTSFLGSHTSNLCNPSTTQTAMDPRTADTPSSSWPAPTPTYSTHPLRGDPSPHQLGGREMGVGTGKGTLWQTLSRETQLGGQSTRIPWSGARYRLARRRTGGRGRT